MFKVNNKDSKMTSLTFSASLVTFTEEIRNGKLHFFAQRKFQPEDTQK